MLILIVLIFNVFCSVQSATLERKNENFALQNYGEILPNPNTMVIKAIPKDGNGALMARTSKEVDRANATILGTLCYIFIVCFFINWKIYSLQKFSCKTSCQKRGDFHHMWVFIGTGIPQ